MLIKLLKYTRNILSDTIKNSGFYSFTSFYISILSGVIISIIFKIDNPYNSILEMIFNNQTASFFRSIHYWSSQLFLIFSLLHIYYHLKNNSEKNVKFGKWIRLCLAVFLIFYLLFSGFLLRNDLDSNSAKSIITTILNYIPLVGNALNHFLFNNLNLVYMNHISLATILLVIISIEHSKLIFPKIKYYLTPFIISIVLSINLIPYLNTGETNIIKGPYYFQGFQELLNLMNYPFLSLILVCLIFILFAFLPKIKNNLNYKILLLILFFGYSILSIIGIFFRGENWKFEFQSISKLISINFLNYSQYLSQNNEKIKLISGKPEGCLNCHSGVKGLSDSHNPESIGCSSCHLGNNKSTIKEIAHLGMLLIPSNLDVTEKTCGASNCHKDISNRVSNSLMNSISGVISVDKWVFGEINALNHHFKVADLLFSPSDLHLRNLCVSCHLGNNKILPDTISELSRGGGCSACHLNYSEEAKQELLKLNILKSNNKVTKFHPDISIKTDDNHCFGCHSRSGRITLNYKGLAESINNISNQNSHNLLDGRKVIDMPEDIHHKAGMMCVDCHISYELMGDGNQYFHKEEQVKIKCSDCHPKNVNEVKSNDFNSIDYETQLIMSLRGLPNKNQNVSVGDSKYFYPNVFKKENSLIYISKSTKKDSKLTFQSDKCYYINGHNSLDCKTCHTKWSPNCVGCHTNFDINSAGWDNILNKETKGAWIEHEGVFLNDYPTLGILNQQNEKRVTTFSPGMIINLNKSIKNEQENTFLRLYSPVSPHTISKESRTCKSCHLDPSAIGYGRGIFEFKNNSLTFIPKFNKSENDNLPEDAWIGFLSESSNKNSTRENARPFNLKEQKNILTVGVCLTCHKEYDNKLTNVYNDFSNFKKYISKKCKSPNWSK